MAGVNSRLNTVKERIHEVKGETEELAQPIPNTDQRTNRWLEKWNLTSVGTRTRVSKTSLI